MLTTHFEYFKCFSAFYYGKNVLLFLCAEIILVFKKCVVTFGVAFFGVRLHLLPHTFFIFKEVKVLKIKKPLIIAVSILTALLLAFGCLFTVQYKNASKKAEAVTAICLSKKTQSEKRERKFLSFNKVYSFVSTNGLGFTVELSGSADTAHNSYDAPFTSTVYVPLLGKPEIKKIKMDDKKIYP